jgi:hypothetical protein
MKTPIRCSALALTLAAVASAQTGQTPPSSIPVHDLSVRSDVFDALHTLAEKYHVVIGVYGIHTMPEACWAEISLKDGTLGEVFNAIVARYPLLEWKETASGAVHFTFRGSPLSLLDVPIRSFDAENPRRMETSGRVIQAPEVAKWLQDHKCTAGELFVGYRPDEWTSFAVHAKNVPFSAVLDEIAAKSGTYVWSAIQWREDPCAINIQP